jgi:hypothetical protein
MLLRRPAYQVLNLDKLTYAEISPGLPTLRNSTATHLLRATLPIRKVLRRSWPARGKGTYEGLMDFRIEHTS